jgi:hypothetical protein
MIEAPKVVAHFVSDRLVKGTTQDFLPSRDRLHIQTTDGDSVDVSVRDLKALFFVRDLAGDKDHVRAHGFPAQPSSHAQGKKVAVLFGDDELACGYTTSYTPDREAFFMVPADPNSNNLRVYVVMRAAKEIALGPAADALVHQLGSRPLDPAEISSS